MATFGSIGLRRGTLALALLGGSFLKADAFTTQVQAAFRKAAPDLPLTIKSEDEISVAGPEGELTAFLEILRTRCASDPKGCETRIQDFATQLALRARIQGKTPFTASKVVPILRAPEVLDPAVNAPLQVEGGSLAHRPFVHGLVLAYVVNLPKRVRFVNALDLEVSGLSEKHLHGLSLGNAESLGALKVEAVTGVPGVMMAASNDGLATSRLLNPRGWKDLERQCGGPIAVVCPTENWVLAARLDNPAALKLMRSFAAYTVAREKDPLPMVVFTRDGEAWREVAR